MLSTTHDLYTFGSDADDRTWLGVNVQTLLLSDDLFPAVLDSRKTCTVRAGERNVAKGWMRLRPVAASRGDIYVFVQDVRLKRFQDISDDDAAMEGMTSATELRSGLRRFYPQLSDDQPVTLVLFHDVRETPPEGQELSIKLV